MPLYSRAIGAAWIRMATYAAISTVAAREMRPAILLARPCRSARHSGQSSPQPSPRIRRPHRTQGTSGSPLGNGTAELLGRRASTQVAGAYVVLHDRGDDGIPDPLGAIQLADMVQHHGGRKHLSGGIGQTLARDVRSAAVHCLEDGRLSADIRAGRQSQPSHQARDLVTEY